MEDIIGTSSYKVPIEEALVEVDRYNEERAQKLNRLRIVEKEKNSLEDAKRETENYLRLQNDLARAHSRLYQWSMHQAAENINVLQQETVGDLLKDNMSTILTQTSQLFNLNSTWNWRKTEMIWCTLSSSKLTTMRESLPMKYAFFRLQIFIFIIRAKGIRSDCEVVLEALATHEKQEVGLKEKKKHLASKTKKLTKAIQEVSCDVIASTVCSSIEG